MLEKLEDIEDLKMLEEMRKKPLKSIKLDDFLTEQERSSTEHTVRRVREFSKEEPTIKAKEALRRLCEGIFESEEDLASNHDFYLYGAPKRK